MTSSTTYAGDDYLDQNPDEVVPGTRVAGLSTSTPLARRLLRRDPQGMEHLESVPMLALVTTQDVRLAFSGPRAVPRLSIRGTLDSLVAVEPDNMPYRIEQISLDAQETIEIEVNYSFTTEQLQDLVGKGLYLEGFEPPREWVGLAMEFPTEVDVYVAPPLQAGDPPLVVTDLRRSRLIDSSLSHSGYKFEEAFPDYRGELLDAGALSEYDMPEAVAGLELSGFDFGTDHTELVPAVVEISGLDFDAEAVRRELTDLGGHDFQAPDQLRILRNDEQQRLSSGAAELARAGLGSRDDERVNRQFHTSLAERRRELETTGAGVPEALRQAEGAGESHTGRGAPGSGEADLLDAFEGVDFGEFDFGEDASFDMDTGDTDGVQAGTETGGVDFGSMEQTQGLVAHPAETAGAPAADLLGTPDTQEAAPAAEADAALLELDENDAALRETETDTEQEKARKAARRARLAVLQRAKRARERAARQAAAAEEMDQSMVQAESPDLRGLDAGTRRTDSDSPELG